MMTRIRITIKKRRGDYHSGLLLRGEYWLMPNEQTKPLNHKFVFPYVKFILLVNGALTNEQIEAKINSYGTVRIITKDENALNGLYFGLKNALVHCY